MLDFAFALAFLAVASVGAAIVATNVPFWLDRLCAWWLARHATRLIGGLTFFRLPTLSGSTYTPKETQ